MIRDTVQRRAEVAPFLLATLALAVLALCTTAWTTFDRGLFQDDMQVLFDVHHEQGGLLRQAWLEIGGPTRRLQGLPYALALRTAHPLEGVLAFTELLPFLVAVTTMALARQAARLPWPWAFLAGALTITATSDWLTASPVALGYQMAVLLHVAGALGLVLWARHGGRIALALGVMAGTASLWTIDAATTVYPFTPLVAWLAAADGTGRRRAGVAALVWWVVAIPYFVLFVGFLFDDASYAAIAVLDRPWWHRLARLVLLVAHNVMPWRWGLARGEWFGPTPLPPPGPTLTAIAIGLATAALTFRALRRDDPEEAGVTRAPDWRLGVVCAAFAVLANATYMSVQLAFLYYRTHVHARVWASLALTIALALLARRGGRSAWAAAAIATLFLTFGIAGGQERQRYFAEAWQRHRVELASLAEALPSPPAHLLLTRSASPGFYVATQVPYLARFWAGLLGDETAMMCRVSAITPAKETSCRPESDRLVCEVAVNRTNRRCGPAAGRAEIPYANLVVADYDTATGRYEIVPDLPSAFTPEGDAGGRARVAYAPMRLAPRAVRQPFARQLLQVPDGATTVVAPGATFNVR
jgi:hypothetical protein